MALADDNSYPAILQARSISSPLEYSGRPINIAEKTPQIRCDGDSKSDEEL